ncbi:unnamed protein product [Adineta steineri]|uniref:G-protein coupled receptors family 1 profile domain-containing protein n=1 Tax=Adineta steineri TaxID=433720 RepID=A0A815HXF7_9BILA|nr:unnamed protein product [Adineta steineri]CAF1358444.1 unnamed protein product [Adineta steineri]
MSNTTTLRSNTTVAFSLDYYYALYVNPPVVIGIFRFGYPITFFFGFIGSIASLLTFSRLSLRKISTGCLFMVLSISDTIYLCMCVIDFVEFGLEIPFYHHIQYDSFCRFRSFAMYVSQVLSAWTLVIISFDRWIRTRFPYKSGSICTPKKAMLLVFIILLLDIGIHSHVLTPLYGMLIPGFAMIACGPTIYSGTYFIFYFLTWSIIQILIISLIPVVLMLIFLTDIYINIQARKRAVIQPTNGSHDHHRSQHQKNLQRQMFILMLTSIGIFLTTTLPVATYKITSARQSNISTSIMQVAGVWIGLGWFQSLNYALNFYSHCLTSTLFRKEFILQMKYLAGDKRARANKMEVTATAFGTQTQVR